MSLTDVCAVSRGQECSEQENAMYQASEMLANLWTSLGNLVLFNNIAFSDFFPGPLNGDSYLYNVVEQDDQGLPRLAPLCGLITGEIAYFLSSASIYDDGPQQLSGCLVLKKPAQASQSYQNVYEQQVDGAVTARTLEDFVDRKLRFCTPFVLDCVNYMTGEFMVSIRSEVQCGVRDPETLEVVTLSKAEEYLQRGALVTVSVTPGTVIVDGMKVRNLIAHEINVFAKPAFTLSLDI